MTDDDGPAEGGAQPYILYPKQFDPSRYMRKLSGNDYLDVKWRLLWLRIEHPDADIETALVKEGVAQFWNQTQGVWEETPEAVFKARISIPGGGSAMGWGSETKQDFKDYREKAETKAIGRALAALGFGTQFSGQDWADGAEAGRPVDSPVAFPQRSGQGQGHRPPAGTIQRSDSSPSGASNPPQRTQTAQQGQTSPRGAGNAPQGHQGQGRAASGQRQQGGPAIIRNPNDPATPSQVKYVEDLMRDNGYNAADFNLVGLTKGEASEFIESLNQGRLPAEVEAALGQVSAQ